MKANYKAGFTLIELLVVIAIIGLLGALIIANVGQARAKSRTSRAKADLNEIYTAIALLKDDTGVHPGPTTLEPWVQDVELDLNACEAGLECSDGSFTNWNGPYMAQVPKDPWGRSYRFDPDYTCRDYVVGCESFEDGIVERVILTFGPNRTDSQDYDDGDNIVVVLSP